jgi:hypothetical protein
VDLEYQTEVLILVPLLSYLSHSSSSEELPAPGALCSQRLAAWLLPTPGCCDSLHRVRLPHLGYYTLPYATLLLCAAKQPTPCLPKLLVPAARENVG